MLTIQEKIDFSHLERDIENGKTASLKMAQALLAIRDRRLYVELAGTFEEYCEQRWQFSRQYGYSLCSYAESVAQIESVSTTVYIPQNEWQARPLKQLETAEEKIESLNAAATIAHNNHPDATHIKRAVAAVKTKANTPAIGSRVTVLDERHEHYGKTVEVIGVENNGILIQCKIEGQEAPIPLLHNEVSNDAQPKPDRPSQPLQPKINNFAVLQTELDIERLRVELLERELKRLIDAIEQNYSLLRLKALVAEIKPILE